MWYVRIGAKLRGPFTEEQLKQLRRRGELSAVHQFSTDRVQWQSMSVLFAKWEAGEQAPAPTVVQPPEPKPVKSNQDWYYATRKGEQLGPVSRAQLEQLAATRQIYRQTLVYGPGMKAWAPASEVGLADLVKRPQALALPLLAVGLLSILTVAAVAYLVKQRMSQDSGFNEDQQAQLNPAEDVPPEKDKKTKPSLSSKAGKITRVVGNDEQLKDALARVQIVRRLTLDNGSVIEQPYSHGSGFCVSPNGYFLTNRHVVEDYEEGKSRVVEPIGSGKYEAEMDMDIFLFIRSLRFPAKLVYKSPKFDLAVVKIERSRPLPYFELSSSSTFEPATVVHALGFPGFAASGSDAEEIGLMALYQSNTAKALAEKKTVTAESQLAPVAFDHSIETEHISKAVSYEDGKAYIYHRAMIFPGNSGGPLVDSKGTVIGINTIGKTKLKKGETEDKDGKKSTFIYSDGALYQAFIVSQFRPELTEFVPEKFSWK